MTKYYVIHVDYVGPNRQQNLNAERVDIDTECGRTNMSAERRPEGWLGETNGWTEYAHGEFQTLDEARAYVEKTWDVRLDEDFDPRFETGSTVARYLVGDMPMWNAESTSDWAAYGFEEAIKATTTDAEIEALAAEWEAELRDQECAHPYPGAIEKSMFHFRDDLVAELEMVD